MKSQIQSHSFIWTYSFSIISIIHLKKVCMYSYSLSLTRSLPLSLFPFIIKSKSYHAPVRVCPVSISYHGGRGSSPTSSCWISKTQLYNVKLSHCIQLLHLYPALHNTSKAPNQATTLSCRQVPRLTSDFFCVLPHRDWAEVHDFCLSRSHYTDTNPTRRERAPGAGIKPKNLPTRSCELYRLSHSHPYTSVKCQYLMRKHVMTQQQGCHLGISSCL